MNSLAEIVSRFIPWRFAIFLLGCLGAVPFAIAFGPLTGTMTGFDLGAILFLISLKSLFAADPATMRRHARENDANRTLILAITGIVMGVLLVVIASELRQKEEPSGATLALVIGTLALAWLFSNLVYTLHYAYLYYSDGEQGGDHGGLTIPEREEPDYWDLAYFALTLGMTFQTSDVEITSPLIRRVALFHSLAAFVFNLGIVAFSINIIGG